ncbi:MAG TPA: hypothetical protein VNH40_10235 [Gaiellaceae bacterium]|nr:hypothetical protein [Gaiellaceae bacterium]
MKDTALFVGWGGTFPGRELVALETYREWVSILEVLKEKGEIDDFTTVMLAPHGGELEGFTLVFGDQVKLMELTEREDIHRLRLHAVREHAKFSIIPAVTGELVEKEYRLLEEEILPAFERTPVPV